MGKSGLVFILSLFLLSSVYAIGVTRPVPFDMELMRGEDARFTFQIQAVTSDSNQQCKYSMSGLEALNVEFDLDRITVDAGGVKDVYGTVSIPENTPFDTYSGKLTVSCGAAQDEEVQGSVVYTTIGDSPFTVKVVEVRAADIREIIGENKPPFPYLYVIIGAGVILIVAVVILKRKKSKKR